MDAILFFLGGALTLGAGVAAEIYRDRKRTQRLTDLIKRGIRDDLQKAKTIYDDLIKDYASEQMVKYVHTQAFRDSRAAYDRNRDSIILLDDHIRGPIFDYYLRSLQAINALESAQQGKEAIDRKELDLAFQWQGKIDPTTRQPYTGPAFQAFVRSQMASIDVAQRDNAVTYLIWKACLGARGYTIDPNGDLGAPPEMTVHCQP